MDDQYGGGGAYLLIMGVVFAFCGIVAVLGVIWNSAKTAVKYPKDVYEYGIKVGTKLAVKQAIHPLENSDVQERNRQAVLSKYPPPVPTPVIRVGCAQYVKRGDGRCDTCGIHWYDHAK